MKNIYTLLFLVFLNTLHAQCVIYGKSTLKIGESEYYSPSIDAKCATCYTWTVSGDVSAESAVNERDIKLKANVAGEAKLSIVVATKDGEKTCSKLIRITNQVMVSGAADANSAKDDKPCSVELGGIGESKVDQNTIQFTVQTSGKTYAYEWTVTYKNGEKKESKDSSPKFPFYPDNDLISAQVRGISGLCSSTLSKGYSENFWPKTIEQRVYQQGSYTQNSIPEVSTLSQESADQNDKKSKKAKKERKKKKDKQSEKAD